MPFATRMLASSEQAWEPMTSSRVQILPENAHCTQDLLRTHGMQCPSVVRTIVWWATVRERHRRVAKFCLKTIAWWQQLEKEFLNASSCAQILPQNEHRTFAGGIQSFVAVGSAPPVPTVKCSTPPPPPPPPPPPLPRAPAPMLARVLTWVLMLVAE
jgi:hypothetical protein